MSKPTILVDADSCPVKEEIVEIANERGIDTLFIASYAHMNTYQHMKWKFVDSSKEAVDLYIMNRAKKDDIVVTQDIGLASTLLLKGVHVISPKGKRYEESTIQTALDLRYLSAVERRKGHYGKGPKPFVEKDRKNFVKQLTKILSNLAGI